MRLGRAFLWGEAVEGRSDSGITGTRKSSRAAPASWAGSTRLLCVLPPQPSACPLALGGDDCLERVGVGFVHCRPFLGEGTSGFPAGPLRKDWDQEHGNCTRLPAS